MSNRASIGDVFEQLKQEGYIEAERTQSVEETANSPWYVQGLLGCGGWIAAIFLLATMGFCITTLFISIDDTTLGISLMVLGAVFVGATTIFAHNRDSSGGLFIRQLLLVFHIAGQFAFYGGLLFIFEPWSSEGLTTFWLIIIIVTQVIFIRLFPNVIYRFLAMLTIAGCFTGISHILELAVINSIAIGGLMLVASVIWLDRLPVAWQIKQMRLLHPVGYGAVVGSAGILIYEISNRFLFELPDNTTIITGGLLLLILIWVMMQLFDDYDILIRSRFAVGALVFAVILSLIVISTPGIIAGLIIILMAFRRRNLILQGIGYAFLAGFVIYYYYWLDVTLLVKSIILIVTGIVLLVGRFGLNRLVSVPDEKKGVSA